MFSICLKGIWNNQGFALIQVLILLLFKNCQFGAINTRYLPADFKRSKENYCRCLKGQSDHSVLSLDRSSVLLQLNEINYPIANDGKLCINEKL